MWNGSISTKPARPVAHDMQNAQRLFAGRAIDIHVLTARQEMQPLHAACHKLHLPSAGRHW